MKKTENNFDPKFKWIPVSEHLPLNSIHPFLVDIEDNGPTVAFFYGGTFYADYTKKVPIRGVVTHWSNLPFADYEIEKEEEKEAPAPAPAPESMIDFRNSEFVGDRYCVPIWNRRMAEFVGMELLRVEDTEDGTNSYSYFRDRLYQGDSTTWEPDSWYRHVFEVVECICKSGNGLEFKIERGENDFWHASFSKFSGDVCIWQCKEAESFQVTAVYLACCQAIEYIEHIRAIEAADEKTISTCEAFKKKPYETEKRAK